MSPANRTATHRDAHLNTVESSRRLFGLDPGAEVESGDGWLFGAGRSTHPLISNGAFRVDDGLNPDEHIERARAWFAERGRGFAVWTRAGATEDGDLIEAAERAGLQNAYAMPEMVLVGEGGSPPPRFALPTPEGIEPARVESAADAADYWRVATESYADIGFPPEIFAFYENHEYLWADDAAAFLARVDGRPAAISMTIVSHGVAGIYWVGTTERARGRGLGAAMTAAAVDAGLEIGATSASLQASPMGEPIYLRMGFEMVYDYRLYLCPMPQTAD
ncbi:MAG TPA: GNAT family N-acetyltransferase [Solirubrobacterales bacterium]|nr:GNAT family N-acetyltransferase [Solirubrobacterales bacterium]